MLTIKESSKFLGVSVPTMRRWETEGRITSSDQKQDLQRQIENVSSYCIAKGYQFKVISDLGSGLNYNKKIEYLDAKVDA